MRIALDTNLLAYAEGVQHSPHDVAKARQVAALIERLAPDDIVVPAQVLGELTVVLRRRGGRSRHQAREIVLRWRDVAALVPQTGPETIVGALDAAARHGLQFWDAVILCAAAAAGCGLLLSEDMQDGFVLHGVTVANPFAQPSHPLFASVLP